MHVTLQTRVKIKMLNLALKELQHCTQSAEEVMEHYAIVRDNRQRVEMVLGEPSGHPGADLQHVVHAVIEVRVPVLVHSRG